MSDSAIQLSDWIGRCEEADDVAAAAPLAGLAATLDHPADAAPWRRGEVPPLGHWLSFLPRALQRDIAGDGHPDKARGGLLPPVSLPRRMWAGGSFSFVAPIPAGAAIRRRSTIGSVTEKTGQSGSLLFVKVVHEVFAPAGLAVREEQDLVYRDAPSRDAARAGAEGRTGAATDEPPVATWSRAIRPDAVLLFRFSALTFNGHRIHYDRDYCRDIEGYPGLVVHGPLTATLLMDLFLRHHPGIAVTAFRFRAQRPLFDIHPFTLHGAASADAKPGARLWALDHEGRVAMTADVEFTP